MARPSTSPAATWRSGKAPSRRSADSIRSSAPPGTTSTCAGGCWRAAGRSASTPPPGVAPPPELAAHLLEAANRLRARRGDAGAQVAREVQRAGTRALGGPHLRPRPHAAAWLAPRSHLPRRVGQRAIPVAVRAGAERAGVSAPDARVASADRDAVGDGRTQPALRTSQGRGAPRGRRPAPPHRAGDAECHPRVLSRGASRDRAAQAHGGDSLPAPPTATRPARRPAPGGVDTLASAGEAGASSAVAPDGVG